MIAHTHELVHVYEDSVWHELDEKIERVAESLPEESTSSKLKVVEMQPEAEYEVYLDKNYYGRCPRCSEEFDYDEPLIGRLLRCRSCYTPMRLRRLPSLAGTPS